MVEQYRAMVGELEVVLPGAAGASGMDAQGVDAGQALSETLNNLHDVFIHVAADLDTLHEAVAAAKEAHLARQRQVGGCFPSAAKGCPPLLPAQMALPGVCGFLPIRRCAAHPGWRSAGPLFGS